MAEDGSPQAGPRLKPGDPDHEAAVAFLTAEAWMLDDNDLEGWLSLLSEALVYRAPNRVTVGRRQIGAFPQAGAHYDDDYAGMKKRIRRMTDARSAWAEDPPSRTRRLVANVVCRRGMGAGDIFVRSALLVTRSRMDQATPELISAERRDVLRHEPEGLRLAERTILLDSTILGTANLAIFL